MDIRVNMVQVEVSTEVEANYLVELIEFYLQSEGPKFPVYHWLLWATLDWLDKVRYDFTYPNLKISMCRCTDRNCSLEHKESSLQQRVQWANQEADMIEGPFQEQHRAVLVDIVDTVKLWTKSTTTMKRLVPALNDFRYDFSMRGPRGPLR